jgi:hypothetical protein
MSQEYLHLGYIKYRNTSSAGSSGNSSDQFLGQYNIRRIVIEFVAENHQYFSWAEADFKKDTRGRMMREIPLWIKVFLMEEGMLTMSLRWK